MSMFWHGVYAEATTQFHPDQSLDVPGTLAHLTRLLDAGIQGLVLHGAVGENCSLDPGEKRELLKAAVAHVAHRVPVLTGVAEYTTAGACRFAADCEKLGLDGLMVLPAMVYKSDAREAMEHFRAVARASSLPLLCDNNPSGHGHAITPEMFAELADVPTLVAIKESSENPRRVTDLVNLVGERYVLFAGVDELALECLILGATGWVSGLGNAFPEESCLLWDLVQAGRWEEAREIYRWYTPLLHLGTQPKRAQYIKLAMAERGMGSEWTRAPRLPLEGVERHRILAIIRHALATRPGAGTLI